MQKNLLEYLEHTALRTPDRIALSDQKTGLSFLQLLEQSRCLGSEILHVSPVYNRPVVVLAERNVQSFVCFMGVLQSGNYYVPLDVKMPQARMQSLMKQLSPAAVVCIAARRALADELAQKCHCPVVELEQALLQQPESELLLAQRRKILDVDPAYILFTSGSTGAPKGIVVSHRSVIDFTDWFCETFAFTEQDILGNQSPFFFDLSMRDLYTMLATGCQVHLIPQKCFSFPKLLLQELEQWKITGLNWAASAFHLIGNSGVLKLGMPQKIHTVILGGEALQARQLNLWRAALPNCRFVNVYGPTEATVDCCYYVIDRTFSDTETIPIGKACANMEVFLLDEQGMAVPQGQQGELCVRGSGLASGYFGDWEKTQRAFTQDPRNGWYTDRIYHTGDLAVQDEMGNFVFRSRKDNQIKHGGYRIELGEIETALNSVEGIKAAICFFDSENDRIHCVCQTQWEDAQILSAIRELIPKYMMPNVIHKVAVMPYNPNGKIDRNRLKEELIHAENS